MRDPGASAQHDSGASGPEAVPEVSTPPLSNLAYCSGSLGASRGKGNSLIFLLLVKTPWSGPLYGDSSPVRLAWVTSPVMGRGHREEARGGPGVPAQGETVAETLSREVFPGAYRKPGGGNLRGESLLEKPFIAFRGSHQLRQYFRREDISTGKERTHCPQEYHY